MIPYSIDFQILRRKLRKKKSKKILIQLPEGMKIYALEIADELSDFDVRISSNPCYGACDVEFYPDTTTVQFGHSEIPNISYPRDVIFVEAFSTKSFKEVAQKFVNQVQCRNVGLIASVQHIPAIEELKKILENEGMQVFVGKGDGRIKYDGQVLGCNFSSARSVANNVDCFAFLGTGRFHAIGARIATNKTVYVLNPYSNSITNVDEDAERFLRQRFGAIIKAEEAKVFGIIIGTKIGQRREKLALALKKIIESSGRKAYMFYADRVNPDDFYYDVDIFVNTSCPRITYDDYLRFPRPIVSPIEVEVAMKVKSWDQYKFDEIVEVDGDKY